MVCILRTKANSLLLCDAPSPAAATLVFACGCMQVHWLLRVRAGVRGAAVAAVTVAPVRLVLAWKHSSGTAVTWQ